VIAPQGLRCARELAELIGACGETIPFEVCEAPAPLVVQLRNLDEAIARLDRSIAKLAQRDETARRLMGNRNSRKLLVVGAHAVLFHRMPHTDPLRCGRRS
jgi:transposase